MFTRVRDWIGEVVNKPLSTSMCLDIESIGAISLKEKIAAIGCREITSLFCSKAWEYLSYRTMSQISITRVILATAVTSGSLVAIASRVYASLPTWLLKEDRLWKKMAMIGIFEGIFSQLLSFATNALATHKFDSKAVQKKWRDFFDQHQDLSKPNFIYETLRKERIDLRDKIAQLIEENNNKTEQLNAFKMTLTGNRQEKDELTLIGKILDVLQKHQTENSEKFNIANEKYQYVIRLDKIISELSSGQAKIFTKGSSLIDGISDLESSLKSRWSVLNLSILLLHCKVMQRLNGLSIFASPIKLAACVCLVEWLLREVLPKLYLTFVVAQDFKDVPEDTDELHNIAKQIEENEIKRQSLRTRELNLYLKELESEKDLLNRVLEQSNPQDVSIVRILKETFVEKRGAIHVFSLLKEEKELQAEAAKLQLAISRSKAKDESPLNLEKNLSQNQSKRDVIALKIKICELDLKLEILELRINEMESENSANTTLPILKAELTLGQNRRDELRAFINKKEMTDQA